jgi:hypothetical protein
VSDEFGTWHHGLMARWWAEGDVAVEAGYTGRPATADDGSVAFVAIK